MVWLDVYISRLPSQAPLGTERKGRLARLLTTVEPLSLLPILFVYANSLSKYASLVNDQDSALMKILRQFCKCSTALMLHQVEDAHLKRTGPLETLIPLALINAQLRRLEIDHDRGLLEHSAQVPFLYYALTTRFRHLTTRVGGQDELGVAGCESTFTMPKFLRDVELMHEQETVFWRFDSIPPPTSQRLLDEACAGGEELCFHTRPRRVTTPCHCSLVSSLIPYEVFCLFGQTASKFEVALHRGSCDLKCIDGSVLTRQLRSRVDLVFQGPSRSLSGIRIGRVFHCLLAIWIEDSLNRSVRKLEETGERLTKGSVQSLLWIIVDATLEDVSLFSNYLTEVTNPLSHDLEDEFFSWVIRRDGRRKNLSNFFHALDCVLCVKDR